MSAVKAPAFTIRVADPSGRDGQRCLGLLAAELERRAIASPASQALAPLLPEASFLVAYLRGEPIGCGAILYREGGPSELDRLWVARPARRIGIGRLLLAELELRAIVAAAPAVRALIDRSLHEATTLCRASEYVELPLENGNRPAYRRFEKAL
jgi:GNAT superfamily N-acetyltransferase